MKIFVVKPDELTADHLTAWSQLLSMDPALDSPYLRPEFTLAVASVRSDVKVAVLEQDGGVRGFFPFQRTAGNIGKPVGGRLSDCQAVIVAEGTQWSAAELIRGCGLRAWDFDYLLDSAGVFERYVRETAPAAQIDLRNGFDAFAAEKQAAGSQYVRKIERKARKLERNVGPLRFVAQTDDRALLGRLMKMKSAQYRRSKITDVFAFRWAGALLERILEEESAALAGRLSVLYAGDRVAALHFGMQSHDVFHDWFPVYDTALAKYSPGQILLTEIMKGSAAHGIRRIDLGIVADWKSRVMNRTTTVAVGSVDLRPIARVLRRGWRGTRQWLRASPLRGPARVPARMVYHMQEWFEFR